MDHKSNNNKSTYIERKVQDAPAGADSSRRFHFGSVVGRTNLKLPHDYTITNRSDRPFKILRSINAKPCCGEVEPIAPKILAPGESITLKVTVRIGETLGLLRHRALVETDLPTDSVLEFWTTADVLPRVRVEEVAGDLHPLFPGQSARRRFTAIAYGTATDAPPELDDSTVRATSGVIWEDAARERRLDNQILERTRHFAVELKAGGKPGSRIEDISVVDGKNILWRQQLAWEVASSLKATPPGIILSQPSGVTEEKVVIRSVDRRPFSLLGIESNLPGVSARAGDGGAQAVHVVRVKIEPSPGNAGHAGRVMIKTDHPNQPVVIVSVFVSSVRPAERATGEVRR